MTEQTGRLAVFAVGDRVAARAGTSWDTTECYAERDGTRPWASCERDYLRLHGHHGRVVASCDDPYCEWEPHVIWTGTHDGREPGPTSWMGSGYAWHMSPSELEHAD